MRADDRLRRLFQELGDAPEPAPEHREDARRYLVAAMRSEQLPAPSWWRRPSLGWAAAAVAIAVLAFVFVVPSATRSVDANLANIARQARAATAEELPRGAYIYFRTESVARNAEQLPDGRVIEFLVPETIDRWVRGASLHEQRTYQDLIFDTVADEEAFRESPLAALYEIGEPQSMTVTDVPNLMDTSELATERGPLRAQIIDELSANPEFSPNDEARIFEHVASLLMPGRWASPQLRAALLEVLGGLDVATVTIDDGVSVTQRFRSDGEGHYVHTLEFDSEGFLRLDRLVLEQAAPGGDMVPGLLHELRYSRPAAVVNPGARPKPAR